MCSFCNVGHIIVLPHLAKLDFHLSNSLDPRSSPKYVGLDLDPSCLHRLFIPRQITLPLECKELYCIFSLIFTVNSVFSQKILQQQSNSQGLTKRSTRVLQTVKTKISCHTSDPTAD